MALRTSRGSAPRWPWSRRLRRTVLTSLAVVGLAVAVGACSSSSATSSAPAASASGKVGGSLTVWVDSVRLPVAQAYVKAHPNVHVHIVTFDGDANGATSLQTKIQLWNRTGSGWPDVIFSEQVNDPVWMAKKPFDFAAPLKGLIPQSILSQWPSPSTAQCTVDGTQYCLQDNLAQVVLWYNKKLMNQFGYAVPTTWQQWAALGQKVATEHPGYIIGNIGDSFSHWIYLWGNQCPLEKLQGSQLLINASDTHCTEMASLLDPLIKNGTVPPLSVFTPDFAKKYGGANDKVLMMPGPSWYAQAVFQADAAHPGRADHRRDAAAVEERDADHDRPGRRRPVDHLQALEEPGQRRPTSSVGHDRVQPDRRERAGPGYPAYAPAGRQLAEGPGQRTPTSPLTRRRR